MARTKKSSGANRKSAVRKTQAADKKKGRTTAKPAKLVKTKTASERSAKSAGANRAEGIRLFKLAGRPSKQDFIAVYGPNGPKLTWAQRSEAGIAAEKFQSALAAKKAGR